MIYFDNAATSLYKPKEVKDAVIYAINNLTANPGRSGHDLSLQVSNMVFETREVLKKFFNAENYNVIFTKNCSEALNLAIFGTLKNGDHVITSCYEHNSVLRPLKELEKQGVEVSILDCDLKDFHKVLEENIRENTKLVITTHISNVTGDMTDIQSVGKICKSHNVRYLVDGAQSSGHLRIDVANSNVDMFAFAGHKGLLSITGVGGLLVKNGLKLKPLIYGGTGTESENLIQPKDFPEGFEAGTVPTISIASLKSGVEFLIKNFSKIEKIEENLAKYIKNELKNIKFLKIYSNIDSKNVFCFNFENVSSNKIADILNEKYNICVRAGLHCAPLVHKKLKTLQTGAVRVSLDFFNTSDEIDKLISALKEISRLM